MLGSARQMFLSQLLWMAHGQLLVIEDHCANVFSDSSGLFKKSIIRPSRVLADPQYVWHFFFICSGP